MIRLISILTIGIIRLISIHFVKFWVFSPIWIHFVKLQIFTLISIRFINIRINTSISIYVTRKFKILRVHILWLHYSNYRIRNYNIRKPFSWLFAYNSPRPHDTRMHIEIQNLLSWEHNVLCLTMQNLSW